MLWTTPIVRAPERRLFARPRARGNGARPTTSRRPGGGDANARRADRARHARPCGWSPPRAWQQKRAEAMQSLSPRRPSKSLKSSSTLGPSTRRCRCVTNNARTANESRRLCVPVRSASSSRSSLEACSDVPYAEHTLEVPLAPRRVRGRYGTARGRATHRRGISRASDTRGGQQDIRRRRDGDDDDEERGRRVELPGPGAPSQVRDQLASTWAPASGSCLCYPYAA